MLTILNTLVARPPPLSPDADGVLRVGGTRVRLETVLHAFHAGSTAEEILLKYPSLDLTDIYGVIAYYLWHRPSVDAYLAAREDTIESSRREIADRFPSGDIRARRLARRAARP
jgi:uncharacterized protein (DUF433 family)